MKSTVIRHYDDDLTRGFVVRYITRAVGGRPYSAWWMGPKHGFGTTFGGLDYSTAVFPSRAAAEHAISSGYRGGSALTIQTVKEARGTAARQRDGVTR